MNGIFWNYPNPSGFFYAQTQKVPTCKPVAPPQEVTSNQVEEQIEYEIKMYHDRRHEIHQ